MPRCKPSDNALGQYANLLHATCYLRRLAVYFVSPWLG